MGYLPSQSKQVADCSIPLYTTSKKGGQLHNQPHNYTCYEWSSQEGGGRAPCSYTETGVKERQDGRKVTTPGGVLPRAHEDVPRQATYSTGIYNTIYSIMFQSSTNTLFSTTDPCDVTYQTTSQHFANYSELDLQAALDLVSCYIGQWFFVDALHKTVYRSTSPREPEPVP